MGSRRRARPCSLRARGTQDCSLGTTPPARARGGCKCAGCKVHQERPTLPAPPDGCGARQPSSSPAIDQLHEISGKVPQLPKPQFLICKTSIINSPRLLGGCSHFKGRASPRSHTGRVRPLWLPRWGLWNIPPGAQRASPSRQNAYPNKHTHSRIIPVSRPHPPP